MFRSVSKVLSDMLGCCVVSSELSFPCPFIFALTFCGSGGGARWQRASAWRGEQLGCQRWTSNQHCCQALQNWIPKPNVSQVLCRSLHLEPRWRHYFFNNTSHLSPLFFLFHSKMESRLQRRPRSTSMKDRQNSKAQSDRTSSMESECSPESRLIAQVMCYSIKKKKTVLSFALNVWSMVSLWILNLCLLHLQDIC